MKQNYHQALSPNKVYHLFSRAIGNEKIFITSENYRYFLQQLKKHTEPICKFYSYALLPNHFHLLAKIEDEKEIIFHFENVKNKKYDATIHSLEDFTMERFSNFWVNRHLCWCFSLYCFMGLALRKSKVMNKKTAFTVIAK